MGMFLFNFNVAIRLSCLYRAYGAFFGLYLVVKFRLLKILQEIGHDFGGLEDSTADSPEEKSVTYPKHMVSPVREVCNHR